MSFASTFCICRHVREQMCVKRRSRDDFRLARPDSDSIPSGSPEHTFRDPRRATVDPEDTTQNQQLEQDRKRQRMRQVHELQDLARRLTMMVDKNPSSGMRIGFRPKQRFLAVLPQGNFDSAGLREWKHGTMGWYENEAAYKSGKAPKGTIALAKISKVKHVRDQFDGKAVEIKHVSEKEADLMVIFLKNAKAATEWSTEARTFLSKLREGQEPFAFT